jgi:TPR repeat protein
MREDSGVHEMKRLLLTLVLLWPAAVLADLSGGLAAVRRGDFATAMREWRPLAEAGNADAQFNLGLMYDKGEGVPEDDAEAVKWYRLAAAQGQAFAQYNLGLMYANGNGVPEGVPEDFVQAYAWHNLAAAQGHKGASKSKGFARKRMTPAQIAEAQKLSKKLCAKIPGCMK